MASGYMYKCPQCGKRYMVRPGAGQNYEKECRGLLEKIAAGKKGKAWKEAYDKFAPGVEVKAEKRVYVCGQCGSWKETADMTLYGPDGSVLKEFDCPCTKCKKPRHIATAEELRTLQCPKCGAENEAQGMLM